MNRKHLCACVVAAAATLLAGCDLCNSIFSATDEEAKEAVTLALNVLVETYPTATRDCLEYDGIGLVRYTAVDGTYMCEYDTDGRVRQVFDGYQPNFSDYLINGELSPPPGPFGPEGEFSLKTEGDLKLTGGKVTSLRLDLSTHGYAHDYGVTEVTEVFGSIEVNGRGVDIGPWKLEDLMKRNLDILLALVKAATAI